MTQDAIHQGSAIVLIGADPALLQQAAAALGSSASVPVAVIAEPIEHAAKRPELDSAAVVVVDLDARRRESLIALQGITSRLFGRAPVIVLADTSDDTLLRWFMQVRVSDFLRKPVEPKEVVKACLRALKASSSLPDDGSQILSFLSACGGVGATTLAIETAMLLRPPAQKDRDGACLVALDSQAGACAAYLDLEPRLELDEIGPHPDRLDLQLLEVMLTRHP